MRQSKADAPKGWTELEDDMLRAYYQKYGPSWIGWQEVLPNRTMRALRERARRIGLAKPSQRTKQESKPKSMRTPKEVEETIDPYEGFVFRRMRQGFTPQEIDREKRWQYGTARLIMSEMWAREKREFERGEGYE